MTMTPRFDNLVELCDRSCSVYAERPLFGTRGEDGFEWLTYAEFHRLVVQFRGGLATLGVAPGDRVAIVSSNRVEWAVAAYATYGLGAAFVPLYEEQEPAEWQFILHDCEARVVLGSTGEVFDKLLALRPQLPHLTHVIGIEQPIDRPDSYAALLRRGAEVRAPLGMATPDDVAGLVYTSGTTGKPKGVLLTHRNLTSNINAVHEIFEFEPSDRSLSFLPWAHSFGQVGELHMLLSMGCSMALNDKLEHLLDNLSLVEPTVLMAVPRIFNRIYDGVRAQVADRPALVQKLFEKGVEHATEKNHGEHLGLVASAEVSIADHLIFSKIRAKFGGKLKYAISAGAALNLKVAEFIDALGITVYEGYGLTETSPVVSVNYPGHRKIGSVGKPLPGVTVKIERVAGHDRDGEVIVYGPNVMQGYHRRPEENARVFGPDGGLRTGDLGYLDADGYLFLTGRIKEQYKLENGKYVMPAPLEEELKLSPYVSNLMLYGDNRPFNVAVVVPHRDAVLNWAKERHVALPDGLASQAVRDLLLAELEQRGRGFRAFERPKQLLVVEEEFSPQNGMLTPTLKLKRQRVLSRYQAGIDALYTRAGSEHQQAADAKGQGA